MVLFWLAQIEASKFGELRLALHVVGAVLLVLGINLRLLAIAALGPRFVTDIRASGQVVRDGVYAWLRHPSEIGLLLIAAGGPFLIGAPRTAACGVLLLLPISLWRMRREDVFLASERSAGSGNRQVCQA